MNPRTVLLYGSSLLLSGVASSLEQCADLWVVCAASWEEVCRLLGEHIPDTVIFDLNDTRESHILPLLLENPALVLLGLDPECNQAVRLTGQKARALTVNQIREMVSATNQSAS